MYRVRDVCPGDRTNRSRPSQSGFAGSWRISFWNNKYAAGARLIAVPGWPFPTFSTASAASTRTVSTARWSKSVHDSSCSSKCGTKTGPLSVLTAGGTLFSRPGHSSVPAAVRTSRSPSKR